MKKLKLIDSKHLQQPDNGQIFWFRSETAEMLIIVDSEQLIQSFHIKADELNIRYKINEHLKAGPIDELRPVTMHGNLKPPASRMIRNESTPTKNQIHQAHKVIESTLELEAELRKQLTSILHSTELH